MADDRQIAAEQHGYERPPGAHELRSTTYGVPGQGKVHIIDDGNWGGLGIQFDIGQPPPAEVLEPVKEERRGKLLRWASKLKQWRKTGISGNPVGERLDIEGRTKDAVTRLLESREKERTPI